MKKKSKWPDFLFTVAVRFFGGAFLGAGACFIFAWRSILRAFSHNNTHLPLVILAFFTLLGGAIAAFTTPEWQTPWYKGIRDRRND